MSAGRTHQTNLHRLFPSALSLPTAIHPHHSIKSSLAYLFILLFRSFGVNPARIPAISRYLSKIMITIFIDSGRPSLERNILSRYASSRSKYPLSSSHIPILSRNPWEKRWIQ